MSTTPSARLLERLRVMGLAIPTDAEIRRTRAGVHQRRAGAFSWYIVNGDGAEMRIGSQYPVTELMTRPRLMATRAWGVHEDIHIDPLGGIGDPRRASHQWSFYREEA